MDQGRYLKLDDLQGSALYTEIKNSSCRAEIELAAKNLFSKVILHRSMETHRGFPIPSVCFKDPSKALSDPQTFSMLAPAILHEIRSKLIDN